MPERAAKVQPVLELLEREAEPWGLECLHVAQDGRVLRRSPDAPLRFGFRCLGAAVAARIERDGENLRLSLRAALASVPFTGESAEARRRMLARVRAAGGLLTTDGRAVAAEAVMALPRPLAPELLLAHLAGFMLTLKPEIEALAACRPVPAGRRLAA